MVKECKLKPEIDPKVLKEELEKALDEAEKKAIENLAIYKFSNFGYWASIWVHLNRIGQFNRSNPFRCFVDQAKEKRKGVKQ
jgi:ABC-type iron transport system FetAB ATPase subunit